MPDALPPDPIWTPQDRSLRVEPGHVVMTAWVDVDRCRFACRAPMAIGDVEQARHRLLSIGDAAPWPPPVGHWDDERRFVVTDGRHEILAAIMLGRVSVLVAWVEREDAD